MADEGKGEGKKSLWAQIISSVAVALLVGGTSPWWFNAITGKAAPKPAPEENVPVQTQPVAKPAEATPVFTHDFFVGRWRLEQANNASSLSNNIDYYQDGTLEGEETDVVGNQAQRVKTTGRWEVEKLSDNMFRLKSHLANGVDFTGKFKIIDRNHIQNVDQNYVAERVE